MNIKRVILQFKMFIAKDGYARANILRKSKLFHKFGDFVYFHSRNVPSEPHMISIHNNVSIATNVTFVTHDVISTMLARIPKYRDNEKILLVSWMDKIEIMENVAIGANTTIMYGVTIGPNSIVAAGSTVTKSIPAGEIWGGCPAKKIGVMDEFVVKRFTRNVKGRPTVNSPRQVAEDFFWREYF